MKGRSRQRVIAGALLALCLGAAGAAAAPRVLPGEFSLADGIASTPAGTLLVADPGRARIVELTADGREVGSWGRYGEGPGEFVFPSDVAVSGAGLCAVDRFAHRALVLGRDGGTIRVLGDREGPGRLGDPVAVEVGRAGDALVLDAADGTVKVFSASGEYVRSFGGHGDGAGRTSCPHDLAVSPDGTVLIADSGNRRVQRFREDGTPLGPFGSYGDGAGEFRNPTGVALGPEGVLYVVDHYARRIQVFDGEGREIRGRRYETEEAVGNPSRIAVLAGPRCFVTSPQLGRVVEIRCP